MIKQKRCVGCGCKTDSTILCGDGKVRCNSCRDELIVDLKRKAGTVLEVAKEVVV